MTAEPPPLREIIEEYGLNAKKSLGQHFLLDLNITRKIVRLAEVRPDDTVLEIGPGPGGLTRAILEAGANLIAIERDERCIEALSSLNDFFDGRLRLVSADAMSVDEAEIVSDAAPVKILSNLPYNISTALLAKWLTAGPALWSVMALMFQKEVADRILAAPGTKAYGRLSVIARLASTPSRGFDLPARAFTPPPKVNSTILLFKPPAAPPPDLNALEKLTQAAFSQRRKMLRASLKPLFGAQVESTLGDAGINPTTRADALAPEDYARLAAAVDP